MNKIFFFDIDGTLSRFGKTCPSTIESLKKLKEKGYLIFICSGRPPFYAKNLFSDLVSGYITCNGRCIIFNDKIIHSIPLSNSQIEYYESWFNRLGIEYFFNSEESVYCPKQFSTALTFLEKEYGKNRISYSPQDMYYNFDVIYHSLTQRDKLFQTLSDTVIFNDHGGLGSADCTLKEYDKGHAIKYLLDTFHIPRENAYAFGDGMNDVSMFREVDNKIAMGNAVEQLKQNASFITTSVLEDGIENALKKLNVF